MGVDDDVGIPRPQEPDDGAGLRRIELAEVAVEIEPHRIGPGAGASLRTDLGSTPSNTNPIVPIGIDQRREKQDEPLGEARLRIGHDVAGQHQKRLLATDLAGVDPAEGEDDRPVCGRGFGRRANRLARDHQEG